MEARCQCLTKNGDGPPCKNKARVGFTTCGTHKECKNPITSSKMSDVMIKIKPQIKQIPIHVQDIQPLEITQMRANRENDLCAICDQYTNLWELHVRDDQYPSNLRDKEKIINVCGICYNKCIEQCISSLGKHKEIDCQNTLCRSKSRALQYATLDRQRIMEQGAKKASNTTKILATLNPQKAEKFWDVLPTPPGVKPKITFRLPTSGLTPNDLKLLDEEAKRLSLVTQALYKQHPQKGVEFWAQLPKVPF